MSTCRGFVPVRGYFAPFSSQVANRANHLQYIYIPPARVMISLISYRTCPSDSSATYTSSRPLLAGLRSHLVDRTYSRAVVLHSLLDPCMGCYPSDLETQIRPLSMSGIYVYMVDGLSGGSCTPLDIAINRGYRSALSCCAEML